MENIGWNLTKVLIHWNSLILFNACCATIHQWQQIWTVIANLAAII